MAIQHPIGRGLKTAFKQEKRLPRNVSIALYALLANLIFVRLGMLPIAWMDLPYLPFISWLDNIPSIVISIPLTGVLIFSPLAILVQYRPRLFSLLIGLSILFIVLSSRPLYSTNLLFQACLFLLIGLYRGDDRPFRWQLVILYVAAGLNKALLADWWNGKYMANFAVEFGSDLNLLLKLTLENEWLAKLLGWATIFTELIVLPALLLRRRTIKLAIVIGGLLHIGMLVLTFGKLSILYLYLVSAAYLLLYRLPKKEDKASFKTKYRNEIVAALYFGILLLWLRANSVIAFLDKLT